ncbi:aromatic-ring-hydroxylating dioxygenase subunit beta [Ornithinimicrobium murale]|uniref:aromatic-ring-hydroxylating dioxygenase subunit beta n=1 Tax=Ornithinimicrobium murale TaxID=1050153 RepID=UPI000E0DE447|nr:3-phenylpropionate/cinnamic acid dioxygenase subunit beta [Ornithinimicrobium murale]
MSEAKLSSRGTALLQEVEQFLYSEAEMVDDRQFREWLNLFTDDLEYRVPMARNVRSDNIDNEYMEGAHDIHWIDEGKETLTQRVEQIHTGVHWAEEPLSRTTHLISNVRVSESVALGLKDEEVDVRYVFLTYRHRLNDQEDTVVGRRRDLLRRVDGQLKIARRTIYLNQTVFLARSLSHFL